MFREYQRSLKEYNALDFDDLLGKTLELFQSCPEVLQKYRSKFRYILVDEYQDTNVMQYHIVELLAREHGNICVVGDDDQSIYGWRGADIRNILDFEKDFPGEAYALTVLNTKFQSFVKPGMGADAALEALLQMERRGAWSDGSLKRIAAQSGLEARDTALCTRMTYGVVQNRTLLDYYIDHWCTQKAARLEPVVACLLRLGIYQILFMDKVPDRAAVHETVELTKRRGKTRAAGMINAVLRKCASSKNTLPPLPQNSFISKAAVQYSHPRWLVERLTALVGEQEAAAFLRLDNEPVPTVIQANPLKTTPAELENALRSDGVRLTPHPWLEGCFEVTGTGDLERLSAFASGRCTVQDAAARLAAIAAGPKPGDRVLDVCAAPGGKSFAMAMQMENRGDILSCDIHPHKLNLIENGAARLGITIIRTALADGRERHAGWVEQADVVLADVPCSGLGIIRKKPDIRWKDPAQLAQLPAVQLSILNNVSAYVRPGGVLVYATCTVLPEENGGVVSAFLDVHPDFAKEEFTLPGIGSCPGDVTLWPQRTGTDGFYICRMRRRG